MNQTILEPWWNASTVNVEPCNIAIIKLGFTTHEMLLMFVLGFMFGFGVYYLIINGVYYLIKNRPR